MRPISKQTRAECAAMLQAGKSGNAIAHSLSISPAMVSKIRAEITLDVPWNKGASAKRLIAT
jgi:hypothetical protein